MLAESAPTLSPQSPVAPSLAKTSLTRPACLGLGAEGGRRPSTQRRLLRWQEGEMSGSLAEGVWSEWTEG